METKQEKRGIFKRARDFVSDHIAEIVLGTIGVISAGSMIVTTNRTNKTINDMNKREQEEHEKKMELYEKAKYSDNTSVNINL